MIKKSKFMVLTLTLSLSWSQLNELSVTYLSAEIDGTFVPVEIGAGICGDGAEVVAFDNCKLNQQN